MKTVTSEGVEMRWPEPKALRDGTVFLLGVGGILHETLLQRSERPSLLILFAGCIGLPAFLRADEFRRNGNGNGSKK